jgi:uncharacterized membrane protein (DUF4010 family)
MLVVARRTPGSESAPAVANPFQIKSALKFGVIFAVVLLVVEAAKRYFGAWGVFIAAALAGLTDVDAITLAVAGSESVSAKEAAAAVAVATLSNTLAKLGYALWLGDQRFRRVMVVTLGAALLAGLATLVVLGPRP